MPRRAAIITALILERPLCIECLSAKSGMKPPAIERLLARISSAVNVRRCPRTRCRACGDIQTTISIDRTE